MQRFPLDLYMWTFTWAEATTPEEGAKLWNRFVHPGGNGIGFNKCFPSTSGLRVFEMHPGADPFQPELSHGLHVHMVVDERLPVDVMRSLWHRLGAGGRIHVKFIPRDKALYIAKYLAKARMECLKGVRLWAPVGRCQHTKVKDVVCDSRWTATYQFMAGILPGFDKLRWDQRARLVTSFTHGEELEDALRGIGMVPEMERDEEDTFQRLGQDEAQDAA